MSPDRPSPAPPPVRDGAEGAILTCHVQPRAARTGLAGRHGDALKVRLAAPPVDGAANRELLAFLRDALHCPAGTLELKSGAQGRRKLVLVRGLAATTVAARLGLDG